MNDCNFEDVFHTHADSNALFSAYNVLFMLTGLAAATYGLCRFAESQNTLNYENRPARIIAGFLKIIVRMLHTSTNTLEINTNGAIIAIVPHKSSWEGIAVGSMLKGKPPQFFATDDFNAIPGVSAFLKMFKTITIKAKAKNDTALEKGSEVLQQGGCIALFPQGNFARLGEEPHKIYDGAAKLALKNKKPIHVIRLDGYWSLQNPFIPLFVRNNKYYRALFSALHMNNLRPTLCCVIDFHLRDENKDLPDSDKTREINAQLYAYGRHTEELTPKQIDGIKTEISEKRHLSIWDNKFKRDALQKEITLLKKESVTLEAEATLSMNR